MEYVLFEKTELWISPVKLSGVDLSMCAQVASQVLGLEPEEIMVTDVFDDCLTLDVLVPKIRAERIIAREKALLEALATIPGVGITADTTIHSSGILGLISLDEATGKKVLERSRVLGAQIAERIRKRAIVFATGKEVLNRQIQDTNTPFIITKLRSEGYHVLKGPILEDSTTAISRAFYRAADDGYGIVITTGGIGAESKDQTLSGLSQVDPQALMPYILKFEQGQGRHAKDGVRIGVGVLEQTLIICLPGPHDEVALAWPALLDGLKTNMGKEGLADTIADALRHKFLSRTGHNAPSLGNHCKEGSYGS
jgi:molybdenum cofactor synthesis domain-containing protein